MQIAPELIKKELDMTLAQRLDIEFTDGDMLRKSSSRKSIAVIKTADITNFAQFMRTQHCLENLQFWKEVLSASQGGDERTRLCAMWTERGASKTVLTGRELQKRLHRQGAGGSGHQALGDLHRRRVRA